MRIFRFFENKDYRVIKRMISLLLFVTVLVSSCPILGFSLNLGTAEDETVTIKVNYIYETSGAVVAQPYTAQIALGNPFKKQIEIPTILNYSIPQDKAEGLREGITISKDEDDNYYVTFDFDEVNEDITVTLNYVAGTAKYTIYHYYQNLSDDNYTDEAPTVIELTGDIGAYVKATEINREGYHCTKVSDAIIASDGTTVIEMRYDRDYYVVTFDLNGGLEGPDPIRAKYGTTFYAEDIEDPTRPNCVFMGWSPTLSDEVVIESDMTYVAQWAAELGTAEWTVVFWGQNAGNDEYSYINSYGAWGSVGDEVTYDPDLLISHVHDDDCYEITCGLEEHTHDDGCTLQCTHQHDLSCYGTFTQSTPATEDIEQFKTLHGGSVQNGYVYHVKCPGGAIISSSKYEKWYFYFNNTWYEASSDLCDGDAIYTSEKVNAHGHTWNWFSGNERDQYWIYNAKINCQHVHTSECWSCGKSEHTHTDACRELICGLDDTELYLRDVAPDSSLWTFEKSDTVYIEADGSSVVNVYFVRKEFTLRFREANASTDTYGSITARWGASIADEYKAIVETAGGSFWSESSSGSSPWTNYVGIMPQRNITYYLHESSGSGSITMSYYGEDLNGDYQLIFSIELGGSGYSVSDEDRYEFEGYTYDHGTSNGESCDGAAFYYRRNTYALTFFSASAATADSTQNVLYQDSLGQYDYTPTEAPSTVGDDSMFAGWYLNPECTGEEYDLSSHVMPSNALSLYAKWVTALYTVRTYTDSSLTTLYMYEGYTGIQEKIGKYEYATEPTEPTKDGYKFNGWYYMDGETEMSFGFNMPITQNYDLYPVFVLLENYTYTVHYYKTGTTEKVADDKTVTVQEGTTITENAKTASELNLVEAELREKFYTSTESSSLLVNSDGLEITFYYNQVVSFDYTVNYEDGDGNTIAESESFSSSENSVTVSAKTIENYSPRENSVTKTLDAYPVKNQITFIYDKVLTSLTLQKTGWENVDENQTFVFTVRGTDSNTEEIDITVTVHGNGTTKINDLPVGAYTITEKTDWSFRYSTVGDSSRNVTLTEEASTLTFDNTRTVEKWLDSSAFNVNHFDD